MARNGSLVLVFSLSLVIKPIRSNLDFELCRNLLLKWFEIVESFLLVVPISQLVVVLRPAPLWLTGLISVMFWLSSLSSQELVLLKS